jgi:hypothetical protein
MYEVKESTTEIILHMCCPVRHDVCLLSSYAFMQCVMNRGGIKHTSGREHEVLDSSFVVAYLMLVYSTNFL